MNPISGKVYVLNGGDNSLSVIDAGSGTVTNTPVGAAPKSLVLDTASNKVYVANGGSYNVTVVDEVTGAVASIALGSAPEAIAINTLTGKIYASGSSSNIISVIDIQSGVVNSFSATGKPSLLAVNPMTSRLFAIDQVTNIVDIIDGATNSYTQITTDNGPRSVAINSRTNNIYVANMSSGTVSVIDTATNAKSTLAVGAFPVALVVNEVRNKIYVVCSGSSNIYVIDGATRDVKPIAAGTYATAIALNPVTNKVYIVQPMSNSVVVLDGDTNITKRIAVQNYPVSVVVNDKTNKIYIANSGSNSVSVIDGISNVVTDIPVGTSPRGLAVDVEHNRIYVSNYLDNTISVIDGVDGSVNFVAVETGPLYLAVNPKTQKFYVSNQGSGSLSVVDGKSLTSASVSMTGKPTEMAVDIVKNRIYIANDDVSGGVMVVDGASSAISNLTFGSATKDLVLNANAGEVYAVNYDSGNLTKILSEDLRLQPISIDTSPQGMDPSADPKAVYITTDNAPSFSATVSTEYAESTAYQNLNIADPPAVSLYYVLDSGDSNGWLKGGKVSNSPGSKQDFVVNLRNVPIGYHKLYVFASYGDEGSSSNSSLASSPVISAISAYPFIVTPIGTSLLLSSDGSPRSSGDAVTFTAEVVPDSLSASIPTGVVSFSEGAVILGSSVLSELSGKFQAVYQTRSLAVGAHTIIASYSGDASYKGSTQSAREDISGTPSKIAFISGFGQSSVIGKMLATPLVVQVLDQNDIPVSGLVVSFSGREVEISNNGSAITNSSGLASITITPKIVGSLTVKATVLGLPSEATITLTGLKMAQPLSLKVAAGSLRYGTPVSLIATVPGIGTGAVSFSERDKQLSSALFNGSQATAPGILLTAGSHTIKASWPGDENNESSNGSMDIVVESAPLTITVDSATVPYGDMLPVFTGKMMGLVSGDLLNVEYNSLATAGSPVGSYSIVPTLEDPQGILANYNVVKSPGTLTVVKSTPTVSISASADSSYYGQTVVLTASVLNKKNQVSGVVSFYDGSILLESLTLEKGEASLHLDGLTTGSHNLFALYTGSSNYNSASSARITVSTSPAALELKQVTSDGASPSPITLRPGEKATIQFSLSAKGRVLTPISVSCSGLPQSMACQLSSVTVDPASLPVTITASVSANPVSASTFPEEKNGTRLAVALAIPGIVFLGVRKVRAKILVLYMGCLLSILLVSGLTACGGSTKASGGSTDGSTEGDSGTYIVTVTGSSSGATSTIVKFTVIAP